MLMLSLFLRQIAVLRVGAIHESPANSHKQTIGECRGGYYPPAKIRTKQTDNPEACPYGVIIKHPDKPQFNTTVNKTERRLSFRFLFTLLQILHPDQSRFQKRTLLTEALPFSY